MSFLSILIVSLFIYCIFIPVGITIFSVMDVFTAILQGQAYHFGRPGLVK